MNGKQWTTEECEYMRTNYPHIQTKKISDDLGRSIKSIYIYAYLMGLRKTQKFLSSPESGILIKGCGIGKQHRYSKGHIPANKGKKQIEFMSPKAIERTKKTRFTHGHLPKNTKQDGEITFRKYKNNTDCYFIRIKKGKWIPLAHKIWMDHNGEIPKGGVIRLKDGNSKNCDISNLELIDRKTNMRMNSIQNWPKELIPIVKLNSKLKKQLKEYGKH